MTAVLTVGSLFSGIGGFDLGLERAGMRIIWQSEIDPYASAVLRKHWPDIPNHGDIRSIHAGGVERPDVLCGGFPCQDISNAGKRAGIDGERSGLWSEFARVIGELRPRYVLVENVAALLGRGIERVLGDLAAIGFDAEWHCIPAVTVGAPHRRDRVWVVAYPNSNGAMGCRRNGMRDDIERNYSAQVQEWQNILVGASGASPGSHVADAARRDDELCDAGSGQRQEPQFGNGLGARYVADALFKGLPNRQTDENEGWQGIERSGGEWWRIEPDVGRVAHGVPSELDGDLNAEKFTPKTGTAGNTGSGNMSWLRRYREDGATPSRLFTPGSFRDSVCSLSRQSGLEGWHAQGKTTEELQGLWEGIHAEPQRETQHLQPGMLIEDRSYQCDEALGCWSVEPSIPRVANGVPQRVDRLRCLGNAIVPQVAEVIGRAVVNTHRQAA